MKGCARGLLTSLFLALLSTVPAWGFCPGDCSEDGTVTVDELVRGVAIALGNATLDTCTAMDRSGDGSVTVDELIAAVNNALDGCPPEAPPATARRIADPADLIGGPLAVGRVGDFLLANDRIRVIIGDLGRDLSFMLTFGGNIIDADKTRPEGEPGRDMFGAMTPLINIASTVNVTEILVVNDGSDGRPAVIRTFGVDDLFDPIDPTNAIRSFGAGQVPPSAQDRDIPVEITTEYSLAPGADSVRIETAVRNVGDSTLRLYVGDFLNGSGELDTFVPSLGFGDATLRLEVPYVAYTGVDAGRGLSYGIIPEPLQPGGFVAGSFAQSGVTVVLIGQDVLSVLLAGQQGVFVIPAGQTNSFVRHFTVGDGDVDSVVRVRNELFDLAAGTVRGQVLDDGLPAAGARVSAVRKPGDAEAEFDVVSAFRTDENGRYEGVLPPGNYFLMAKLDGRPYDSGTQRPIEHPVTVTQGGETVQNFDIAPGGLLRVTVADEAFQSLPAKISVVGLDPTPDPMNNQTVAILAVSGYVFGSPVKNRGVAPFGLTDVLFADASGDTGPKSIPAGEYEVVVSRGPEYSVHRERVTITPRETTNVAARLVRVVDTSGFVSADYHVHLINSADSMVSRDERILTMAAEQVEYFVASDHDYLTDLTPDIERLGLQSFVRNVVSDEISTFNIGHFNAWPLQRDPSKRTGGSIDWGRDGVAPGMGYPSLGSYDLSPAELLAAANARLDLTGGDPDTGVVQINHINSGSLGFLHLTGTDTGLIPPQSFTPPERIRQDPSLTNLYDDNYSSLEVWIEANRAQTALFLEQNLGDWFNLLNQGLIKSGTANSDTHDTVVVQAGGPRNFVASSTDAPAELVHAELAASINSGRSIGSSAPFVRVTVEGDEGQVGGLALDQPRLVRATGGQATIRLNVQSPLWAEFDTIDVYANVVPAAEPDRNFNGAAVPKYVATPTLTLTADEDFQVDTVVVNPDIAGATRLEANLSIPLAVERDTWVMVVVRGTDGVSRPMWPMNAQDLAEQGNDTLDDLTDGNLGELGNTALAFTNPVFIDVDGNGEFDPLLLEP